MADVAARWILAAQAGVPAGELAAALDVGTDLRLVVHQASGMVSVQASIDVAEALVRLRAYAFATDRRLDDVAEDVVGRRLRFE
jgi:AmiR/NasT family two-component response regulator